MYTKEETALLIISQNDAICHYCYTFKDVFVGGGAAGTKRWKIYQRQYNEMIELEIFPVCRHLFSCVCRKFNGHMAGNCWGLYFSQEESSTLFYTHDLAINLYESINNTSYHCPNFIWWRHNVFYRPKIQYWKNTNFEGFWAITCFNALETFLKFPIKPSWWYSDSLFCNPTP